MEPPRLGRRFSQTDNYETPAWATRALLLTASPFSGTVLEPAAGLGAIAGVLRSYPGISIVTSDIRPFPHHTYPQVDFLDQTAHPWTTPDHIVTNPPFSIALEFAEVALATAKCSVALFLRLQFIESVERYFFFQRHPVDIYVFSSRVKLVPEGTPEVNQIGASTICFAWFIWRKDIPPEERMRVRLIPPRHEIGKMWAARYNVARGICNRLQKPVKAGGEPC